MSQRRGWAIIVVTMLAIGVVLTAPLPVDAAMPQAHTIAISARTFAFEPATLDVRRGDTVTIHLESLDAVHGLFIDGYEVDLQAEPGKSADVTFVADREGKFKFRCSVTCGALHPFMIGELNVTPDLPFARGVVALFIAAIGAVGFFWK